MLLLSCEVWFLVHTLGKDSPPGGATTTGPDATPPQLSAKTCGGGGVGGRGGGIGSLARGGWCARPTRVCVCVSGGMGVRGMYAIIAISRLCQEESLKGLRDQRHSTPFNEAWDKISGAVGAIAPAPLSFKTWGGGGAGGCRI